MSELDKAILFSEAAGKESIEDLAADFYIGSYFNAVARQVESRVQVGEDRSGMRIPMLLFNIQEQNKRTKKKLVGTLKKYLLDAVQHEIETVAEEAWASLGKNLPQKPVPPYGEGDTERAFEYLEAAKGRFEEARVATTRPGQYAGSPWMKIADTAQNLWREGELASDELLVKIFHLEHNNGLVFENRLKTLFDIRNEELSLSDLMNKLEDVVRDKTRITKWRKMYNELYRLIQNASPDWRAKLLPLFKKTENSPYF